MATMKSSHRYGRSALPGYGADDKSGVGQVIVLQVQYAASVMSQVPPEVTYYTIHRASLERHSHFFGALLSRHFREGTQMQNHSIGAVQPSAPAPVALVLDHPWMTRRAFENVLLWCEAAQQGPGKLAPLEDDRIQDEFDLLTMALYLLMPSLERYMVKRLLRFAHQSLSHWLTIAEVASEVTSLPEHDYLPSQRTPLNLVQGCQRILLNRPEWIIDLAYFIWQSQIANFVYEALQSDLLLIRDEYVRFRLIELVIRNRRSIMGQNALNILDEQRSRILPRGTELDRWDRAAVCRSCEDAVEMSKCDRESCNSSASLYVTPPPSPPMDRVSLKRASIASSSSYAGQSKHFSEIGFESQMAVIIAQTFQLYTIIAALDFSAMPFDDLVRIEEDLELTLNPMIPPSTLHQASFRARKFQKAIQVSSTNEVGLSPDRSEVQRIFDANGLTFEPHQSSSVQDSPNLVRALTNGQDWSTPWISTESVLRTSSTIIRHLTTKLSSPKTGASGFEEPPKAMARSALSQHDFKPFRWSVVFDHVRDLERTTVHDHDFDPVSRRRWSRSVEYGGSLWNSYLTYGFDTDGAPQLGIYLHRHDLNRIFQPQNGQAGPSAVSWQDARSKVQLRSSFQIVAQDGLKVLSLGTLEKSVSPDTYAMDQAWGYRDKMLLHADYLGDGSGSLSVVIAMEIAL